MLIVVILFIIFIIPTVKLKKTLDVYDLITHNK